ncbi:MAG TPA: hypothetical protein VMS93_05475 [Candidatus Saccharimonadales bacterium]|nr:hypothetical protein [Candidatus Saccharimonadales bacterium]
MDGTAPGAATHPGARRGVRPTWAEFVWFGYLAWALPHFFVKYWPVLQGWLGGRRP